MSEAASADAERTGALPSLRVSAARVPSAQAVLAAERCADRTALLWRYLLLTYPALLVTLLAFLLRAPWDTPLAGAYLLAVFFTYAFFYTLPVFLPLLALNRMLSWSWLARPLARRQRAVNLAFGACAVLGAALVQLLLYADAQVVRLYNFHLNGFVWNLITTRGGIESLEAGSSTRLSLLSIASGFLLLQALLWWLASSGPSRRLLPRAPGRRGWMLACSGLLTVSLFERGTYCVSNLAEYRPVVSAADTFPLYVPLHWRALGRLLGLSAHHDPSLIHGGGGDQLRYPLEPLVQAPEHRPWNIVWLVAESLRADMLDPEIMPASTAFARRATNFRHHFSGGNGTRMGMFAMFYGLYGNCWFPMLQAGRGPVLMDVLNDDGYDVQAYTSARFTYPEFDRTIFANVPRERLHEGQPQPVAGWQNDRANVTDLLASLDARPADRPFFRFMFFESPHASYDFPPESVIRPDYVEDMDYADLDAQSLQRDIGRIRNRYVNACHHLDSQFSRVIDGLQSRGLLDSTIVILTGDHGEEFLEHGHWGHNSAFTDSQTLTPLVLFVPGRPPQEVASMSSHLDLPATVLALLGVTSPPDRYSLGQDLLGPVARERTVIADWDQMALVDGRAKLVLPYRAGRLTGSTITGADDEPLADEPAGRQAMQPFVQATLTDMGRFLER